MAKRRAQKPEAAFRPLQLDPQRATRADRPPYAIVDLGSNSVRLLVYDQLGRAPMPRFNEKSLLRLAEGLAETGVIAPDGFRRAVQAVGRFRAIADAMGVSRIDAVATEAMRRAANGRKLAAAIEAECGLKVRILAGAEEARFSTLGVISGFFRPIGSVGDMGGGSLEVAEAIDDHVGERWVSLPLGALPVEAMLRGGLSAAKREIDEILRRSLPRELARPVFYPVGGGWRALAKAHMEAVGAPVKVVHGYTIGAVEAREFARAVSRLSPAKLAATPGVTERRARTLPAAALALDRLLKHLAPERVVFSALGLREGFLYSQLSREEQYLDPLVEGAQLIGLPLARVPDFARELVSWTSNSRGRRNGVREASPRRDLRPLRHCAGGTPPTSGRKRVFADFCNFRSSASPTPRERSSPRRSTLVTPAGRMRSGSTRPSACSRLPSGAGRKFLAAPFCSPTASPAACPRCWKARDCGSTRIASDWKSPRPRARPTAKW